MNDATLKVRPATARDLDRLGELYLKMSRAFAASDPSYTLATDAGRMWREHLQDGLKSERIRVLVSEGPERKVVSFLVARVAPSPVGAADPMSGLIEGAFVDEPFRRQGRLRAMCAEAMRWFEMKRVKRVDLIADMRDEGARAAWRKLGFAEVQVVMRAPVSRGD